MVLVLLVRRINFQILEVKRLINLPTCFTETNYMNNERASEGASDLYYDYHKLVFTSS